MSRVRSYNFRDFCLYWNAVDVTDEDGSSLEDYVFSFFWPPSIFLAFIAVNVVIEYAFKILKCFVVVYCQEVVSCVLQLRVVSVMLIF